MEYNALRMDPLYWILQKDSQVQVLQQAAINVVAKHFPGLKQRAQDSIGAVNDLQQLQELIPDLSVLSQGEVDEVLERLDKDQLSEETDL
jgi:hypothetical protein